MAQPRFWLDHAAEAPDHRRFIDPISGIRFYPVEVDQRWLALPGVTSLLGSLEPKEEKLRLEHWRDNEIAAGRDPNARRDQGSRVHGGIESYIRTGSPGELAPDDLSFFRGVEPHLDRFDEFLWNERPLVQGWEHCWSAPAGDPDRLARVISRLWGFAGTPDQIGRRRGLTILTDYKTSTKPYVRCCGSRVPPYKAIGFKKYRKTIRQLICYTLAIEETLGLHIDALQILVLLPEAGRCQNFLLERGSVEFERELEVVKQAAVRFWSEFGQARRAGAALIPAPPAAAAA